MATEWSHGHKQSSSIFGDSSHSLGDGDSLIEPAEAGVRPPGLATNQRGVRHVDADRDVVHWLCKDRRKKVRIRMERGDKDGGDEDGGKNSE